VCCSVLQCVAEWYRVYGVWQKVTKQIHRPHLAVCCGVLQCVAACCSVLQRGTVCMAKSDEADSSPSSCSMLQCAAVRCSVVQCVAEWRSRFVALILQYLALCCRMLQCVAEWWSRLAALNRLVAFTTQCISCVAVRFSVLQRIRGCLRNTQPYLKFRKRATNPRWTYFVCMCSWRDPPLLRGEKNH